MDGHESGETQRPRRRPTPQCPIRLGEPCSLCQINVTGPEDCGLVYLVMSDDELRETLAEKRRSRTRDN